MKLEVIPVGALQVNCYVVWDELSRAAVILDPGDAADDIAACLARHQLTPCAVLLTHGHVDHIGAVPEVARRYALPVWCHPQERALYFSPNNAVLPWLPAVVDLPPSVDRFPDTGNLRFTVLETPGHTPGGVCYYLAEFATVFTGDTLFLESIGRSDLPGGDFDVLMLSIRSKLLSLPPETVVYPGHGPESSIGHEATPTQYLSSTARRRRG